MKITGFLKEIAIVAGIFSISSSVFAVPSFSRQTGQDCGACHIGGFGPQLTPYGIKFKIGGYTEAGKDAPLIPVSGMLTAGFTHTKSDQSSPPNHYKSNNNTSIEEASIFLAGKIADGLGSFSQLTWDGIARTWALDTVDLRYAKELNLSDLELTTGISVNNKPTSQDPFNSTPVWRFPFHSAPESFSPLPSVAPVIDGGLDNRTIGATAYALLDNGVYAEVGIYKTLSKNFMKQTGAISDLNDPGQGLVNPAPYWRVSYFKDLRKSAFSAGLFGMSGKLRSIDQSNNAGDQFLDIGADFNYQWLGNRENIFTVSGAWIHEKRKWGETFNQGLAANPNARIDQFKLTGSYHYKNTWGITLSHFNTFGSSDSILYANGKPNSNGWIWQADWTPFGKEVYGDNFLKNIRLGLQQVYYNKFDGSSVGAADNNVTTLFMWLAF